MTVWAAEQCIKDWNRLKAGGYRSPEFFPALLGKLQLRMNYRNHRKIVVIDGRIGFVGGFNVGREYPVRMRSLTTGGIRICVLRAAVTSLAVRFVLDWNYAAKGKPLFLRDSL